MTNVIRILPLLAAMALAASPATAAPIFSNPGNGSCTLGAILGGGACTLEEIEPHSLWQTPDPLGQGASWVSYADTGVGGSTVAPHQGSALNPTGQEVILSVAETFSFGDLGGSLSLWVWADDTARVLLDGFEWIAPVFEQGVCAAAAIGCEPGEFGQILTDLTAGLHTVQIDLFQVGSGTTNDSNPFGLLYSGEVVDFDVTVNDQPEHPSNPVPEPSAALGFGAGLIVFGLARKRNWA